MVAGLIVGGLWRLGSVAAQRRGPQERTGALEQLVAEHLSMGRDRLAAAEARIALLEERLAFHDGFLRISPLPGADRGGPLLATVERVAQARARREAARGNAGPAGEAGRAPHEALSAPREAESSALPRDAGSFALPRHASVPEPDITVLRFPDRPS
jgi:hypothetical protein